MASKQTFTAEQERKIMEEAARIYNSQAEKDKRVIQQYESTPDYNILERTFNSYKKDKYKIKQGLAPEYTAAKNRQTEQFIYDNNVTDKQLEKLWVTSKHGLDTSKNELAMMPNADVDYLVKYYEDKLNSKALQNVADATKNAPVAMNALSSVGNTLSSAGYGLGTGLEWLTGDTDLANNLDFGVQANQDIRKTTKNMIGNDKKVANTLYDVGMGVADFGGALALGGGNPLLARAMQTASAVGSSSYDAKSRGLTDSQAMAEGLAGGAVEFALSKLPFDTLTKTNADDALIKTLLKQGASEALEEGGTSAVNAIADSIIAGENSNFNLKKKEYMASGMSEEEATSQAFFDTLKEIGYEGAVGGLSGGVIGGFNTGVNRIANRTTPAVSTNLEPLANNQTVASPESIVPVAEPTVENVGNGNTATLDEQTTNAMFNGKNSLNSQIKDGDTVFNLDKATSAQEKNSILQNIKNKANNFLKKAMANKGVTDEERNQIRLSTVPAQMAEYVKMASGGKLEIGNKMLAIEGSKLYHEIVEHSNPEIEASRGQIPLDTNDISLIIDTVYNPDFVEYISNGLKSNQREAFALIKADEGYVVVVENVGGKSNPNITPEQILHLNNHKMKRFLDGEIPIEDIIYENSVRKGNVEGAKEDKKNRVIVAQLAQKAPAHTSETSPHSPLFNNSIPNYANGVNNVVPDLANVETVNPYTSTENIQSDNQRVRSYNTTLIEKTDAPQVLKNEFIENPQIYTQLSNKATLESAMNILNNNDLNTAIAEYRKMLDAKNPTAIPLGYNISKQLVADGRLDESVQIIRDMSKALTESGQFSQAAAITLMNNDPETAKRYLIREIDNLNKKGAEKFGKKWKDFEISEDELKKFDSIQPGDADAIKQAYQDVYNRLRKEYPSTFKEKLIEYRRVAMLLNVRTNIRNVVSNAMLFPVRWTSDRVSALGDGVYSLINPEYKRTQSLNPIRSAKAKKLANEIFEANKDVLLGENKYDDTKDVMRDKQVFKGTNVSKALDTALNGAITKANQAMGKDINPSLMETARNFTYYLLQKGDDVFVKKNFVSRLSSYLDAQGITDIADVPPDAITLATQEAMKATFKDDSKFSQWLTGTRKMLNKLPGGMAGDIIMPFTKTPANLAMRGIDYSPVPAITYTFQKLFNSAKTETDATKVIDMLAKSFTGTAAIALGYVLAESGIITGALSDDKDEAQFEKQQGKLAYSIKTPLGYITYDWAQPASIPMILGATIYDSLKEDVSLLSGLKQGSLAVADSWLELSPLQNISEIFGGYGTPTENVLDVLATDFPLSFIPSQLGAIARSGDSTQRTTYSNDYLENLKNQAMAKIPGLSQQLPATYDTWGNEVQRYDNVAEGILANFFNPGQFGNESTTPIDNEILDLYESTGNKAVFPKKAGWTENNQKLSAEEYSEFQRISGSNSYDMVEAFIYSPSYSLLDDEQKVEIISDIYNFSNALADKEVTNHDIESSRTYKKAYSVYEEAGAEGVANFYAIKKLKAGDKQSEIVTAIEQMDLSDNEKGYYLSLFVEPNKETVKLYNSENWDAFYDYYFEKTAKDRKTSSYNKLDPFFSY